MVDQHLIQSFVLTAWTQGGIAAALAVTLSSLITVKMATQGFLGIWHTSRNSIEYALMMLAPPLYVVRVLVEGGGGLPSNAEIVALALAVMGTVRVRRARRATTAEQNTLHERLIRDPVGGGT